MCRPRALWSDVAPKPNFLYGVQRMLWKLKRASVAFLAFTLTDLRVVSQGSTAKGVSIHSISVMNPDGLWCFYGPGHITTHMIFCTRILRLLSTLVPSMKGINNIWNVQTQLKSLFLKMHTGETSFYSSKFNMDLTVYQEVNSVTWDSYYLEIITPFFHYSLVEAFI